MPKVVKALSAIEVSRLISPGVHKVGNVAGLSLTVSNTGARSWLLRATVGTRRREIGLGAYPAVTLASAVEKARAARGQIAAGADPVAEREAAKQRLKAAQDADKTFDWCAAAYMAARPWGKSGKNRQQWENTLAAYASPVLGSMPVGSIETAHILRVLDPIWRAKPETAVRLQGRIELVLAWATLRKYRTGDNPARWKGHLETALTRRKTSDRGHFASLPYAELPGVLKRIKAAPGMGARALEFLILTAARSGEVRGCRWSEFDLTAGVWTVPAERMKAGKEHRVPLCAEALALLRAIPTTDETDVVFWSAQKLKPLSDMTLTAVLKRLELPVTAHGFRSTFRVWCAERTAYPREVCEAALAHAVENRVEAAYQRSDLFSKRAHLMRDWAKFCATPGVPAGNVVPLMAGGAP